MHHTLTQPLGALPDPLPIPPAAPAFDARISPPGSKSLTNRALLLAALAAGTSTLRRPLLDADDASVMIRAVTRLGARVDRTPDGDVRVTGVGGRWSPRADGDVHLDLRNAGTAARFLAASVLLSPVPLVIDGNPRMRQRPIGELVAALTRLGVRATFAGRAGCPPVRLVPPTAVPGPATVEFQTTQSSQVVSALLLVAPWLGTPDSGGLTVRLHGDITSRTYIAMTTGLLERVGAVVRTADDLRVIRVGTAVSSPGMRGLPAFEYNVEPDASGATYFWAAAALCPGARCAVDGLSERSLQGDAAFPVLMARMGAAIERTPSGTSCRGTGRLDPIMADMAAMPDAAITLAVVAAFASGRSVLRGLRTLRVKESDRIEALRAQLGAVGVRVESDVLGDPGTITVTPPADGIDCDPGVSRVEFETYDDHRVAMALALVGLRRPNTCVRDPGCVAKTYPGFWGDLALLTRA